MYKDVHWSTGYCKRLTAGLYTVYLGIEINPQNVRLLFVCVA